MNKKGPGSVFVAIGAVLMLSALLLFIYNTIEAKNAGNASRQVLNLLQEEMDTPPVISAEISETMPAEPEEEGQPTASEPEKLEAVMAEGYWYIGYLSIPGFELELPVQESISEEGLYKSPCLQYGTPMSDDAVIAGHNYKTHFLPLHQIESGETVCFTYLNGFTVEYEVVGRTIIEPTNIPAVQESDHDLVLYTCTSSGADRVAVYCDRIEKQIS